MQPWSSQLASCCFWWLWPLLDFPRTELKAWSNRRCMREIQPRQNGDACTASLCKTSTRLESSCPSKLLQWTHQDSPSLHSCHYLFWRSQERWRQPRYSFHHPQTLRFRSLMLPRCVKRPIISFNILICLSIVLHKCIFAHTLTLCTCCNPNLIGFICL